MKKQTVIYMGESDRDKLEQIKEKYKVQSNGEMIRLLITNEYFHLRQMKN